MVWLSSAPPSVDHHLCSTRSDFRSEEVKGRGRRRDDLLPLHALRPHGILWVCPTFSRKPCLRYVVGGAAAETGTWTIARDPVSRTTPGLARTGHVLLLGFLRHNWLRVLSIRLSSCGV